MRVLVTGGAGYIGSHTVKRLAKAGFDTVVLDNLSTGHRWAVRSGELIEGDLSDRETIRRALVHSGAVGVIHFAASTSVGESVIDPKAYYQNNVVNTLNLLDAMVETGVKRFIFSSSAGVYGIPEIVPIPEEHPLRPISPYGDGKAFVERILQRYGEAYGLEWVALRYFNAAGADLEGELGEAHDPETHLIPLAIEAALGRRPALRLFGTDYPTPDGTAVRDYVHVVDLAEAHLCALRYLMRGGASLPLNVGAGRGYSVREIIAAVERAAGRKVPVVEADRRPGDPPVLVADLSRARQILGWEPKHSDLVTLVESALRWHIGRAG